MGYKVANSKSYKRGKTNPVGSKGLSQVLLDEMLAKVPKGKRSRFARELAKVKKHNPEGSAAFKAGYKWYYSKLKGKSNAFNADTGARAYLKKHGYEGTLELSYPYPESVKARKVIAQQMLDDFIDGASLAHDERLNHDNPGEVDDSTLDSASEMASKFHGREPQEIIEVDEVESYDGALAVLGDLDELVAVGANGYDKITITFKTDKPKLACDGNGQNMEIVGGDQEIEIEGAEGKKGVPVGYVGSVVYTTDKHHLEDSNGDYPEPYEHFLGEEFYSKKGFEISDYETPTDYFDDLLAKGVVKQAIVKGLLPMLVYDVGNGKMMLVGGSYTVEDVGIRN